MEIIKNNSLINTGYSKDFQMLTNFVFEITDVKYLDNLYGYFTLKITKFNGTTVFLSNVTICGPNGGNFKKVLSEVGEIMFHPDFTFEDLLSIFSYEFDAFSQINSTQKLN